MNTNSSILSLQHSDQISIDSYKDGKKLKSLWLSIPAYCHLKCPYCFASTNAHDKKIEILSKEQYENIIRDFAALGGEFIGIPGDGEPFHPSCWELVQFILTLCNELRIKVALFTTGDLIFFDVKGKETKPNYEKIEFIKDKDVVLLIKYNHSNGEIQNRLVGGKHSTYTELRERALDILIDQYHFNDAKRIGLVTSVMRENAEKEEPNGKLEIINIYERTKRQNLIFDCDTILELGRGKTFTTRENGVLSQVDLEKVFRKLSDAGAVGLNQGGTYVGNTCCDRILHHLYIKSNGDVFPCIGCSREDLFSDMKLGNIKTNSLEENWRHPFRRKLAEKRHETLIGVCADCENFKTEKCYSCLGRCIISDEYGSPINNHDPITTVGCLHHKPSTTTWLANLVDYIRTTLSYKVTTDSLKDINTGLEHLWRPNKNIAYTLCQLPMGERIKEINNLIDHEGNPQEDDNYKPFDKIQNSRIADFSQQKHIRFSDLQFPMNKVWDFIKHPEEHFKLKENFDGKGLQPKNKQKFIKTISQSFLSNAFLPSFKILINKYDFKEQNFVYCIFILYDNIRGKYFYRTIANGTDNIDEGYEILISRWFEDLLINGRPENPWKDRCHNLSASLRHELYGDYELQLESIDGGEEDDPNLLQRSIDLSKVLAIDEIKSKLTRFRKFLESKEFIESYSVIKDFINTKIFTELNGDDSKKIKDFYTIINNNVFFNKNEDNSIIRQILAQILQIFEELKEKLVEQKRDVAVIKKLIDELNRVRAEGNDWKFVNYFVYLGVMHDILKVNYYYLLNSTNFATINPEQNELLADKSVKDIIKASGIVICTKRPIRHDFRAELKLFFSNIIQPLDEYYFHHTWAQGEAERVFREKIEAHRHTINNFLPPLYKYLAMIPGINDFGKIGLKRIETILNDFIEKYVELGKIDIILEELVSYFKSGHNIEIGGYKIFPIETTSNIQKCNIQINTNQQVDFFTICYNLLHNTTKAKGYPNFNESELKEIMVNAQESDSEYIVVITNPGLIKDEILQLINKEIIIDEDIQEIGCLKPSGGLVISKKLCTKNHWHLSCEISNNTTTIFKLRIVKTK